MSIIDSEKAEKTYTVTLAQLTELIGSDLKVETGRIRIKYNIESPVYSGCMETTKGPPELKSIEVKVLP